MNRKLLIWLITIELIIVSSISGCSGNINYDYKKIIFDYNINENQEIYKVKRVKKGELLPVPEVPQRSQYAFGGWYTDREGTQLYDFSAPVDAPQTLYAKWLTEAELKQIEVNDIANSLEIEYTGGDYETGVAHNIGLKKQWMDADVSWVSNNSAVVSADGVVVRPDTDTNVELTATVTLGDKSATKTFNILVIAKSTLKAENIKDNSFRDIEELNYGEQPFISKYEDDSIASIGGTYSDIKIKCDEDAILSLNSVKGILGINNPQEEFACETSTVNDISKNYVLQQYYKGLKVLGRKIIVLADLEGETVNLNSGYLSGINISTEPGITAEEALEIVAKELGLSEDKDNKEDSASHEGNAVTLIKILAKLKGIDIESSEETEETESAGLPENADLVIYSLENGEAVLAYEIIIYNMVVYVNANDGSLLSVEDKAVYLSDASKLDVLGVGKNEHKENQYFTIDYNRYDKKYYLRDRARNINIYKHTDKRSAEEMYKDLYYNDKYTVKNEPITSNNNLFQGKTSKTAISAYKNITKTYDWYYNNFKRRSLDGRGRSIDVYVRALLPECEVKLNVGNIAFCKFYYKRNNACWLHGPEYCFLFFDNNSSKNDGNPPTTASCLDIVAHEYNHAVFDFATGEIKGKAPMIRSINEGYSDIFGCLVEGDENWFMGEDWDGNVERNIENPEATNNISVFDLDSHREYQRSENPSIYKYSTVVSHSAWLMKDKGMDSDRLAKLWYYSMSLGYTSISTFYTVSENVVRAGELMGMSADEMDIIREAFKETNILSAYVREPIVLDLLNAEKGTISGKVVAAADETRPVENARVSIYKEASRGSLRNSPRTDSEGRYSVSLTKGSYKKIVISADGYIPVEYTDINLQDDNVYMETALFIDRNQYNMSCSAKLKVTSATTGGNISDATVKLRKNWNNQVGDYFENRTATTDSDGNVSFDLPAGYYTAEISKNGYTTGYCNIISTSYGKEHIFSISPVMLDGNIRIVLTWDRSVMDLDSHLVGPMENGRKFHVWYSNKKAYDMDEEIANLDVDDTTYEGPETVTVLKQNNGKYKYSVHNYSGGGSNVLPNSHAKIQVYRGSEIWADFNVPTDKSGNVWNVFEIVDGEIVPINDMNNDTGSISDLN